MNRQNWRKKAFLFGIFGNIQDIIISTIAMFFYAGGTSTDPTTRGYSFWLNMFSDLGRTVTYSGVPNTISNILLAVYACIWGISTGVLFIALPPLFAESCKGRWTSCLAVLFALIGASTLAGVTFVPEDVYPIIHGDLASYGYLVLMSTEIFTAWAILATTKIPRKYAWFLLIASAIILFMMCVYLVGPNVAVAPDWLSIYAGGQKMMTYPSVAAIGALAYAAWKTSDKINQ